VRFVSEPPPAASIDYSYIWNVNRILSHRQSRAQTNYAGLKWPELEAFSYLLDFDSAESEFLSTTTYGARAQGSIALGNADLGALYAAEFACQKRLRRESERH
jgi:hypothetical protein